jgi:hypothetical protein
MSKWEGLEKAARAATPGPWIAMEVGNFGEQLAIADEQGISLLTVVEENAVTFGAIYGDEDAAYIAAANPTVILELLAERDALKKEMRDVAMLLLDNDRAGIKQWAAGVVLGESDGNWSVRTTIADQQKEIDALKAELDRIKALEPFAEVRLNMTGGNAGLSTHIVQLAEGYYPAGTKLYTLEKP